MTRLLSISSFGLATISSLGLVVAAVACSSTPSDQGTGGTGAGATGGASGTAGKAPGTGGSSGTGAGATGGTGGGTGGAATGGAGGVGGTTGGAGGVGGSTGGAGSAGAPAGGSSGVGSGGTPAAGGTGGDSGGMTAVGGAGGMGGTAPGGGMSGTSGMAGAAPTPDLPPLVTSAMGAYWKTDVMPTDSTAAATVTVNDTAPAQKWDGFGGAFNELGWKALASADMQTKAMALLFSATDGANFAWGRIPIGASDYAESRYTCDGNSSDPTPDGTESNRPASGTFSLTRDGMKLIPYIKAAQGVKSDIRFWASPWTPPVSMKTSYKKNSGADSSKNATKPSYFDGGNMKSDATTLTAYADYYKQFVEGYKAQGINIEIVSPQNEPGYDQNYPSALWDGATYAAFVGTYLGPVMAAETPPVKIMLGTLSNDQKDFATATTAAADSKAKPFFSVIGAQWNTLDATKLGQIGANLPVWATEHKCGNYPWNPSTGCGETSSTCPAYNSTQAPNDQAYGVESWIYIRNAIKTVKVTSYNAWNMVLDKSGLGIDTTRDWKQDALLVADSGAVTPTPAYYVFRHMSQYVQPNAMVVGTTGGDALAWKNPDGSLVAVMYNSGATNAAYVVAIGGKKLQFSMPGNGWATVKVKP